MCVDRREIIFNEWAEDKCVKERTDWRGVFDRRNRLVGIAEKAGNEWLVTVTGSVIGTVATADLALELIESRTKNERGPA